MRAERQLAAQKVFALGAKAGKLIKDRRGAQLKARETRLEQERQKILQRIAERTKCTTTNGG